LRSAWLLDIGTTVNPLVSFSSEEKQSQCDDGSKKYESADYTAGNGSY
jgi:hypothetical protein